MKTLKNLTKFFHSDYWILKNYKKIQDEVFKVWATIDKKSDIELLKLSKTLQKKIIAVPKNLDKQIPLAYALFAESILRVKKIRLHKVQILGAIALHFGNVAEMKTGEGKTLTALLPAYLNALTNKPVYIVTVNEYLALRDYNDNKEIFSLLGITTGKILNKMEKIEKISNYEKNIIYITNSEIGFDYLRDNMVSINEPKMQRELSYVIVDEADSILIDEARTPLIISGNAQNRSNLYHTVDKFVKSLKTSDYEIDLENKRISLRRSGFLKANMFFNIKNIYDLKHSQLFHFVCNGLHANFILMKNIDYLIQEGKVNLIDTFTGRIMGDRKLSDGLHQAIEAKENVKINEETTILATVTYQNFFRLFDKISGMTGTAKTIEDEFIKTYNMHVLEIPTDLPLIRDDKDDVFFYNKKEKYLAIAKTIEKLYEKKQPVLVGSSSVQTSEEIGLLLKNLRVPHKILNAKRHAYEAKIIAEAGLQGAVTIATNMAGRGTDIKLDNKSKKNGGLALIGAERNESQRIDLQLRGRSGRQGEPGYSQFYVSLDDDLISRFGNLKFKKRFNLIVGESIQSSLLTRAIKKAQQKLTSVNLEQRKTLLEFDNVISQQRNVVYKQRDFLREKKDLSDYFKQFLKKFIKIKITEHFNSELEISNVDAQKLVKYFRENKFILSTHYLSNELASWTKLEIINWIFEEMWMIWTAVKNPKNQSFIFNIFKQILLQQTDYFWTKHLDEIMRVKSASFLHGYAQKRPLEKFIEESEELFIFFKKNIILNTITIFFQHLDNIYKQMPNRKEIEALKVTSLPVLYDAQI